LKQFTPPFSVDLGVSNSKIGIDTPEFCSLGGLELVDGNPGVNDIRRFSTQLASSTTLY
jgi:hypothetical protein